MANVSPLHPLVLLPELQTLKTIKQYANYCKLLLIPQVRYIKMFYGNCIPAILCEVEASGTDMVEARYAATVNTQNQDYKDIHLFPQYKAGKTNLMLTILFVICTVPVSLQCITTSKCHMT